MLPHIVPTSLCCVVCERLRLEPSTTASGEHPLLILKKRYSVCDEHQGLPLRGEFASWLLATERFSIGICETKEGDLDARPCWTGYRHQTGASCEVKPLLVNTAESNVETNLKSPGVLAVL